MGAFTARSSKKQKDEGPQTIPRDPLLSVLPILFKVFPKGLKLSPT